MLNDALWTAALAASVPLLVLGLFSCYWMTYAWHSAERYESSRFVHNTDRTAFSFSLIVPVRNESYEVLSATVACALAQTHPDLEVVISVGFDDPETRAVAGRIAAEDHSRRVRISISRSPVHNKPTQLNAALRDCRGDVVGILDAESLSAPDLVRRVDAAFQAPGVRVVQGGVIMTNFRSSFVALRCCLEYYVHHRSKMHFSSDRASILMGGNTVFFARTLLEELGGWDETNLAEDAEISLRILRRGQTVTVAYDPALVSREEAPATIRAWVKQRTRWNLGFLQTIRKGVWRTLPTRRQRHLALWHLLQPSIMAFTGLVLPLSLLTYFVARPPLLVAMLLWLPVLPTVLNAAFEVTLLHLLVVEHGGKARVRDYARLVLSIPVYQVMLAWASVRAVVKYARGDVRWEKTVHLGLHLDPTEAAPVANPHAHALAVGAGAVAR